MSEFLFSDRVWFLGPKPPYKTIHELASVVLQGLFEDKSSGELNPGIYAFSDYDLAARFLEKAGSQASHYMPLSLPDAQLVKLLEELQRHGHKHLATDKEQSSYWWLPIAEVADQIRRRAASEDSSPGSRSED